MNHKYEDSEEAVYCDYCNKKFETKNTLMYHRKSDHKDKINMCRYFLNGGCAFDAKTCWYSHVSNQTGGQQIKEFICSECKEKFNMKVEFMKHKKNNHPTNIQICMKHKKGFCQFGDRCWFKHENDDETIVDNSISNENIEQLFGILEMFTERIILLENKVNIQDR